MTGDNDETAGSCLILLCFFLPSLASAAELDIYKPYGSWVGQEGSLYTANPFKSQIHKFNADGNLIWTYGIYGSSIGELRAPQGIAIDSTERIYVVDTGNHRIVRLLQDASGPQWDTVVVDDQSLYLPRDIAIDANDHLFVVDAANRVLKFDTSGNPVLSFASGTSHEFGSTGSAEGELDDPYGISLDIAGNIYVADTNNRRVQKFSPDGTYLLTIGSGGTGGGTFLRPRDVAVTAGGHIFVADSTRFTIQEFDSDGNFLSSSEDPESPLPTRSNGETMAMSTEDYLYVTTAGTDLSEPVVVDVDTTPPLITITGVEGGAHYNHAVAPVITIVEPHPSIETIFLNSVAYVSGTEIEEENHYTLQVYAEDRAGNSANVSIAFVIDLTPPMIHITGIADGGRYDTDVTVTYHVTDNFDLAPSITANYSSGTVFSASGTYTLNVTALDKAGNQAAISASFEIYKLCDLAAKVSGSDIHEGFKTSLLAKLQSAEASRQSGQSNAAVNILEAFIHALEAQRGKKVPEALADEWISFAWNLIHLIASAWDNLTLGELFVNPGHPELSAYDELAYQAFFDRLDVNAISVLIITAYKPEGLETGRLYIQQEAPFEGSGELLFDAATSFNLNAILQKATSRGIRVLVGVECFSTVQNERLDPTDTWHQGHLQSVIEYLMGTYPLLDGIVLKEYSYGSSNPAGTTGVQVLSDFLAAVRATISSSPDKVLAAMLASSDNDTAYEENVNVLGHDYWALSPHLDAIYVETFQSQDKNLDGLADYAPSWVGNSIAYLSGKLNPMASTYLVPLIQTFDVVEPWDDLNNNGICDGGESFNDINGNEVHDIYITMTPEEVSTTISLVPLEAAGGIGVYDDQHTSESEWESILNSHPN